MLLAIHSHCLTMVASPRPSPLASCLLPRASCLVPRASCLVPLCRLENVFMGESGPVLGDFDVSKDSTQVRLYNYTRIL